MVQRATRGDCRLKTWWRSIVEHVSHSHGAIFHILRILCAHPSPFCQIGGYNLHTQWSSSRYDALGALAVSRKQQAVYGCSSLVSLLPPHPLSLLALFHARLSTRLLLLLLLARYVSRRYRYRRSLSLSFSLLLQKDRLWRKRAREKVTVRRKREREVEHGGTLQGVTFGANSVPSGCLHQFYRRFLNPDVGTDFTRSRLSPCIEWNIFGT